MASTHQEINMGKTLLYEGSQDVYCGNEKIILGFRCTENGERKDLLIEVYDPKDVLKMYTATLNEEDYEVTRARTNYTATFKQYKYFLCDLLSKQMLIVFNVEESSMEGTLTILEETLVGRVPRFTINLKSETRSEAKQRIEKILAIKEEENQSLLREQGVLFGQLDSLNKNLYDATAQWKYEKPILEEKIDQLKKNIVDQDNVHQKEKELVKTHHKETVSNLQKQLADSMASLKRFTDQNAFYQFQSTIKENDNRVLKERIQQQSLQVQSSMEMREAFENMLINANLELQHMESVCNDQRAQIAEQNNAIYKLRNLQQSYHNLQKSYSQKEFTEIRLRIKTQDLSEAHTKSVLQAESQIKKLHGQVSELEQAVETQKQIILDQKASLGKKINATKELYEKNCKSQQVASQLNSEKQMLQKAVGALYCELDRLKGGNKDTEKPEPNLENLYYERFLNENKDKFSLPPLLVAEVIPTRILKRNETYPSPQKSTDDDQPKD